MEILEALECVGLTSGAVGKKGSDQNRCFEKTAVICEKAELPLAINKTEARWNIYWAKLP